MRRLKLDQAVKEEFGPVGVTQTTIDIFARRLQESESAGSSAAEDGTKRVGSISVRNGQIVLSELMEAEQKTKISLLRSDLEWLESECVLIPAVATSDPDDAIIRFRQELGGRFFDDIFGANGSGRVLISDDYHLRQWGDGLLGTRSAWLQALMFHLEVSNRIPTRTVVKSTVQLCQIGEDALTTNSIRLLSAAEMLFTGELSQDELTVFCSLLGQSGADIRSHLEVAASSIRGLWEIQSLITVKEMATSIILRSLIRFQGSDTRVVLDTIQVLIRNESAVR